MNQFRLKKWPTVCLLTLLAPLALTGGCSTFDEIGEKAKIDYRSAGKRPTLEVPPDLASPGKQDRGVAGPTSLSDFQKTQTAAPAAVTAAGVLPAVPGVKVERSGTQRWLVVDMKPDQLWPIVVDFWNESGFTLASQSPQTGVMETDWAENRAKIPQDAIRNVIGKVFDGWYSTGERDKFRVRIDSVGNGSELYISHKGLKESVVGQLKDTTVWGIRPNEPELEAEFLRRIVMRLGVDRTKAEAIATAAKPTPVAASPATTAAVTGKAKLEGTGPTQSLVLSEPFDRGWRQVGLALDRSGFTVEDRDRSQGVYFVRYVDPEMEAKAQSEKGFLGRVFSQGADIKPRNFRILVKQATGQTTAVTVTDSKGISTVDATEQKVASRILSLLFDQLK
jgi:outer membrane protein assembly factor BamC